MYQAVIFDMDGLMFDSEAVWGSTWEPAFSAHGLTLQPGLIDRCAGLSQEAILSHVEAAYGGDPRARLAVLDHRVMAEELLVAHGAPTKPGLVALMDALDERGVPMAVASSSPRNVILSCLGHAGIAGRFAAVLSCEDGYASKPSPSIFLAAARELGSVPVHTLVLEDSANGVRAAAAGAFHVVVVPDAVRPDDDVLALALLCCDSLDQVIPLIG